MTATLLRQTARQRLTAIRNALALADDLLATAYTTSETATVTVSVTVSATETTEEGQ